MLRLATKAVLKRDGDATRWLRQVMREEADTATLYVKDGCVFRAVPGQRVQFLGSIREVCMEMLA
jgi:hypothetical protein